MRIIDKQMLGAIMRSENFKLNNTRVHREPNGIIKVYLHDNLIAVLDSLDNTIIFDNCGYHTKTTCARLNAIAYHFLGVHVQIKKGVMLFNGEIFDRQIARKF